MDTAQKIKKYVLLVIPNIDLRFSTSMLIQQFGLNVCSAQTTDEALDFLRVAPPAGIIAEAGPTGSSLLPRIRKEPVFSDIPVIFLSSTQNRALEDQVKRGELAACLRSPLDVEEFYRVIQTVVEKGSRRNIRIGTALKAKLEHEFDGVVTVLSQYGMFFRTLDPRPVKSRVPVSIEVKGRTIRLEALVLYTSSFDEGPFKEPGMGMKFANISPDDSAFLKAFILEQLG